MDFGLAKLRGQVKLTRTGTTIGTVAYMSPEQARGEEADHRTDVWSLGVVMYEILTGQLPFKGEYEQAVIYSILNAEPETVTTLRSALPVELGRIVRKAIAKDPSERYQHIEDMLVDLRSLHSMIQHHMVSRDIKTKNTRNKVMIVGFLAIVMIAFSLVIFPRLLGPDGSQKGRGVVDHRKMIVVLPFENLGSPEDEYFANGTTDAITARLASVSGLGIISRQSSMQYKKTTKSIRQIGSELGVDYILEGTVQRERPSDPTSRVRVIPQLIRVADDTHVWADTYDENMTEVFQVQSDIAERVAMQLDVALLEPELQAIQKKPTENLAAYEDYLRGTDYMNSSDVSEVEMSVSLFQKAVSLDPRFAEAWAGLAVAHRNLYWAFDRPGELILLIETAQRAQQLAPDSPETHLALGYVAYAQREFGKALEHFQRAERLRPSGETAQAIGYTLRRLGRWQEALNYGKEARRFLPRSAAIYSDILGATNWYLRRFDEAEQNTDQAILLSPHLADAYLQRVQVLVGKGNMRAAEEAILEMSRRIEVADAAEYILPQGLTVWMGSAYLRLFPETFTKAFEAFEAGPMERYRDVQPAMIASTHLARAIMYETTGERQLAAARYDSARVHFERVIRSNPQSAYVPVYQSDLGLAYAGLGRCEEAIRMEKKAVEKLSVSEDAAVGPSLIGNLAEIYVKCGKYDAAIDQLEICLSMPSGMSVGHLRADPIWDPLRTNPRFRRLMEGK
jgi:TolB-like protein/Flp pilus assembly protein TadD